MILISLMSGLGGRGHDACRRGVGDGEGIGPLVLEEREKQSESLSNYLTSYNHFFNPVNT